MEFKSLVKQYQSIEEDSSIEAESKDVLLAYFKNTFPQQTKISFNIYHTLVPVGISLLALLFIFISGAGLIVGAKNTLPGNFLYPVKLGYEEARMITIFDTSKKAVLRAEILTNRLSEAKVLAQRVELGERGLEQDMQYLAQSFTNELKTLKKQIAAQVPEEPEIVPFPEEKLLFTDKLLAADYPDLPIADEWQVFTVVQSDKLQTLLNETKELLAKEDLVTALARIEQAEKLTEEQEEPLSEEPAAIIIEEEFPSEADQSHGEVINDQSLIIDQSGSLGQIIQEAEETVSIDGTYREETATIGNMIYEE